LDHYTVFQKAKTKGVVLSLTANIRHPAQENVKKNAQGSGLKPVQVTRLCHNFRRFANVMHKVFFLLQFLRKTEAGEAKGKDAFQGYARRACRERSKHYANL